MSDKRKTEDVAYMLAAIDGILYCDNRENGLEPLYELVHRMRETQPNWLVTERAHRFDYLMHLCCVREKLREGEWSYACHEMADVLQYSRLPNGCADALVMQNAKKVLEEGLENAGRKKLKK